jgi:signal transduction histidine kinase
VRSLGAPTGRTEIDRMGAAFDRLLARLDDALRAERRLTADASHELRTPLTALSGELERVEGRAPAEGDVAASIGRARTQVAAMSDLVEALLLVQASSGTAGEAGERFESVNLCDQARDAVSLALARHAGRSHDVALDAPDEILVTGHPALVASAIHNLVDNALKFTRAGQPVRVRVAEDDRGAAVIVEDGGPGVPEEDQRRVFDPFFRSAEARAGTQGFGLGLPIVARVALAHRGSVTLSSSSALAGARFELWLPPFASSR